MKPACLVLAGLILAAAALARSLGQQLGQYANEVELNAKALVP